MKTYPLVALLMILILSPAAALSPVSGIVGTGQWNGASYVLSASSGEHLKAIKWNPEKKAAPLSFRQVTTIARAELRRMVGEGHRHFKCDEIKLSQENRYWFFVVTFQSSHPDFRTDSENSEYPAILPFIVYLDGAVELPFQLVE